VWQVCATRSLLAKRGLETKVLWPVEYGPRAKS